jgi:hypothetical protein
MVDELSKNIIVPMCLRGRRTLGSVLQGFSEIDTPTCDIWFCLLPFDRHSETSGRAWGRDIR